MSVIDIVGAFVLIFERRIAESFEVGVESGIVVVDIVLLDQDQERCLPQSDLIRAQWIVKYGVWGVGGRSGNSF